MTSMTRPSPRWLSVLIVVGAITSATSAGAGIPVPVDDAYWSPQGPGAFDREIAEAAARYEVPPRLVWAVIHVESGFNRRAVSRRGARGLMQLMPQTAAVLGVRDCFNARQNIDGGTRHLRGLLMRFRHDVRLAVAAYNAGEKPVLTYGGVPPYPETRQYVADVMRLYHAPVERRLPRELQRVASADGSVLYTNLRFGHLIAR